MIKRKGELADYEYRKSIDHVYFTLLVKSAVSQNIKDVILIEASAYSYIFLEFLRMNPKHQGHSKRKNALYLSRLSAYGRQSVSCDNNPCSLVLYARFITLTLYWHLLTSVISLSTGVLTKIVTSTGPVSVYGTSCQPPCSTKIDHLFLLLISYFTISRWFTGRCRLLFHDSLVSSRAGRRLQ